MGAGTVGAVLFGGGFVAIVAGLVAGRQPKASRDLMAGPRSAGRLLSARSALADAVDTRLHGSPFGPRFEQRLRRAGVSLGAGEFVVTLSTLLLAVALVLGFLAGSLLLAAGVVVFGVSAAFLWVSRRAARWVRRFDAELPEALDLLAGSLEAGSPVSQAIAILAAEGRPPLSDEFARVLSDTRLGTPLAEALEASAVRVGSRDYTWCVRAFKAQQEFGASLAELMRTLAEFMRWRAELRGEVRALTAEGRISAGILIGLPITVFGFFLLVRPNYLSPLIETPLGFGMLVASASLLTMSTFWMRRIVKVEV